MGVLIAVIAILQEFEIKKPRERAVRQAQFLTQLGEFSVAGDAAVAESITAEPAITKYKTSFAYTHSSHTHQP